MSVILAFIIIAVILFLFIVGIVIYLYIQHKPQEDKYYCSSTGCSIVDNNTLPYSTMDDCKRSCGKIKTYGCNADNQCVLDPNGKYSDSNCGGNCHAPPPGPVDITNSKIVFINQYSDVTVTLTVADLFTIAVYAYSHNPDNTNKGCPADPSRCNRCIDTNLFTWNYLNSMGIDMANLLSGSGAQTFKDNPDWSMLKQGSFSCINEIKVPKGLNVILYTSTGGSWDYDMCGCSGVSPTGVSSISIEGDDSVKVLNHIQKGITTAIFPPVYDSIIINGIQQGYCAKVQVSGYCSLNNITPYICK